MAGDPLGPHVVGQRVVVRRLVRGETGPSGGPAMTDVLGTCVSWDAGTVVVRRDDGTVASIPTADVVAGKTVPPRRRRARAWDADEADRLALPGWPPVESEPLGDWVLRASGGFSNRGNSVLALRDPGLPLDEAVERVAAWYAARSLEPRAHVHPATDTAGAFEAAGWAAGTETVLMLGPADLGSATSDPEGVPIVLADALDDGWLATDPRAARHGESARHVLETGEVALATVRDGRDAVLARGRASVHGDWVGISSLWTAPEHRGRGLGTSMARALLAWGGRRGAVTAYLQVERANDAALRLYEGIGFTPHHHYVYYALGGLPQRTASPGR